jgi:hypothetical protein
MVTAIIVAVVLSVVLLAAGGILFVWWRRRRSNNSNNVNDVMPGKQQLPLSGPGYVLPPAQPAQGPAHSSYAVTTDAARLGG